MYITLCRSGSWELNLRTRALVLLSKIVFAFWHFWQVNGYFTIYWTNIRYVCTYLIAFLMEIPNMVMKFNNFDIVYKFVNCLACRLHSLVAWKALSSALLVFKSCHCLIFNNSAHRMKWSIKSITPLSAI